MTTGSKTSPTLYDRTYTFDEAKSRREKMSKLGYKCFDIFAVIDTKKATVDPKTLSVWQFGVEASLDDVDSQEELLEKFKKIRNDFGSIAA